MKEKYLYSIIAMIIILAIFTTGCVSPPQENPTPVSGNHTTKATTKQPDYVAVVSLTDNAASSTIQPQGYSTFIPTTQIPEDITCRIHAVNLFGYNGTGFIFDLKNPPMFINYTVVPKNVTKTETYTEMFGTYVPTQTPVGEDYIPKSGKGSIRTITYSDYSPNSWFEVTVRDNRTNQIILQEGFGETKGYSTYLTRTLKVLKTGEIRVEFRSNDMKNASATIWVKPRVNYAESRLSEFTNCMYWEGGRDTLVTAKPTTIKGVIYTWTPENKATNKAATMVTQGTEVPRNQSNYAWE
jgi:hypothetical protein